MKAIKKVSKVSENNPFPNRQDAEKIEQKHVTREILKSGRLREKNGNEMFVLGKKLLVWTKYVALLILVFWLTFIAWCVGIFPWW